MIENFFGSRGGRSAGLEPLRISSHTSGGAVAQPSPCHLDDSMSDMTRELVGIKDVSAQSCLRQMRPCRPRRPERLWHLKINSSVMCRNSIIYTKDSQPHGPAKIYRCGHLRIVLSRASYRPRIHNEILFQFSSLHAIVGCNQTDQYVGPRFATLRSRAASILNCTDQNWKQKINLRVI